LKPEFTEVEALLSWLGTERNTEGHILVDGFAGSGKSTLAKEIAKHGFEHIAVDGFAVQQMDSGRLRYVDVIDLAALKGHILKQSSSVIDTVTGLDLGDVLAVPLRAHIYVKHLSKHGVWHHADQIVLENRLDSIAPPNELRLSQRRYHIDRRPHEVCDAVFIRQDPSEPR
jgi:cytidylate kinase